MTNDSLLRGAAGGLPSIPAGPEVRNLPQVNPGDRLVLRYTEAVTARIARLGDPVVEPTASTRSAAPGERPWGTVVDRGQVRVTIEGANFAHNTAAFLDPDRTPRTVAVRQPAMQASLHTSKVGYEINVIFLNAVALSVEPAVRRTAGNPSAGQGQSAPRGEHTP